MDRQSEQHHGSNAPWYRQKVFWLLMAGPVIVVFAAMGTLKIALDNTNDMVSDDYYKDGKHINLQLERDVAASQRHLAAQVLFNEQGNAAKVFISGDFDRSRPIKLLLLHPAKKSYDQNIVLQPADAPQSGDKTEYRAVFKDLPPAVHWYVRLEDSDGVWRVEEKWLPSQGSTVSLKAKDHAMLNSAAASVSASAP